MVNKHQFQMLAKAFRAGKISLSDFTEQAYNPPAGESTEALEAKADSRSDEKKSSDAAAQ